MTALRRLPRRILGRCLECGAAAPLYCIECQARLCPAHADGACDYGSTGKHIVASAEPY